VSKKLEQLINFYNELAPKYEELYGEEQKEKQINLLKELYKYLKIKKEILIFDLGCGIGFKGLKGLKKIKDKKIKLFGLDISFNSLIINKNKRIYDFLINCDLNNFCFEKIMGKKKEIIFISCSSLQNLEKSSIIKILSLDIPQIHSVMYKSKGKKYWENLFKNKDFKLVKEIRNDLLFSKL